MPSDAPGAVTEVSVVIITLDVAEGSVEASGMVPDVVESDGVCQLTLRSGAELKLISEDATPGPSSTYCGVLSYPVTGLSSGEWTATLTYRSPRSGGESAERTVQIP